MKDPARLVKLSSIGGPDSICQSTELAARATARDMPALAQFDFTHIFVSDGCNSRDYRAKLDSVDYYNIAEDSWHGAPKLNTARFGHSSCSVGRFIFVIGGEGSDGRLVTSVERIDARKLLTTSLGQEVTCWEQVICPELARISPLVSAIGHSTEEIIVSGGLGRDSSYQSDAFVFHVESMSILFDF